MFLQFRPPRWSELEFHLLNIFCWGILLCDFYSHIADEMKSCVLVLNWVKVVIIFFSTNFRYNSVLLTSLEFNCTVRDYLCPWHWLRIDFSVIRNCIQKFVLCTFPKKASKDLDNPVQLTLLLLTKMHLSQLSHTQLMKIIRGMSFANSLERIWFLCFTGQLNLRHLLVQVLKGQI